APSTPSSASIGADTSPVNAPESSKCMFCAATRIAASPSASVVVASAVNGGHTHTSTRSSSPATSGGSATANAAASGRVLCIFQLAAQMGVRLVMGLPGSACSMWQVENFSQPLHAPCHLVVEQCLDAG